MPQCMNCGKKGFLLSLDQNGLCNACQAIIGSEVVQRVRIIQESQELVKKSANFRTRLSRLDLIISQLEHLIKYEEKGIAIIQPSAKEISQNTISQRQQSIDDEIHRIYDSALQKSGLAGTPSSKISPLLKAIDLLGQLKLLGESELIQSREQSLKTRINWVKFNDIEEKARRAEFKGNSAKALSYYQDALFHLLNDEIPDEKQNEKIHEIRQKIDSLKK